MSDPNYVVTMTIADNPLKGQPGQSDFTITFSSEPDYEPEGLPDPEDVPLPILIATEMLSHITGMAAETAFTHVLRGSSS